MKQFLFDSRFMVWVTGCLLLVACTSKTINPRVSLWYQDKIPYGTWFAYNSLYSLFPEVEEISLQQESPDYAMNLDPMEWEDSNDVEDSTEAEVLLPELYIVISTKFLPSKTEKEKLLQYARRGNHLVISSLQLDESFLDTLGVEEAYVQYTQSYEDTTLYTLRTTDSATYQLFGYPGEQMFSHFTFNDSSGWKILGTNQYGAPNCIRKQMDSGSITLHANPLQFSNFFLLHKKNYRYWSELLTGLPHAYSGILWDDYFRLATPPKENFSSLGVFMNYPSLKWALYTILLMLLLLLFSEVKRRRKIIPVVHPPVNSSLDFVQTIGRLYYQHKDNADLARKIEMHFMEFIRQHYHLYSNQADDQLVRQLSLKSGVDAALLESLFYEFRMIEEHGTVADEDLLRMNDLIEEFHIKRS